MSEQTQELEEVVITPRRIPVWVIAAVVGWLILRERRL
jgi:hypothetical protein